MIHGFGLCLGLVLSLLMFWPAHAQAPQVQQISLLRTPEGLLLSARMGLQPASVVEEALYKAVPLYFVWHADVYRARWYWTDKRVATATRTLRLAYQPLTRRWRVSLSNDMAAAAGGAGMQYALHQNFDSLNEALAGVGRVARWRVADAARLEPGADHEVEFSFRLDLSLLPRPFQIGMGNQAEWNVEVRQTLPVPERIEPEKAADHAAGVHAIELTGEASVSEPTR
ncbi:MAG: DUF4390 domain-containing protein [Hydrogenophaga sp.]|jgi:hypothetical protein|uniref:DUF4390 domain-containing protein n=1 Tax=Hydrogenophaga sp. TaxID=1904254 RepID=UPI001D39EA88|nr:DUF4390 domain-containing protein [Hydrogenophaga sp.]MBW0169615.1 DUF4390 domain-containing protein [Hydrogenophaga sp.]MBW0182558.1 DUF4390 domain-containing protein [Hydrogenophaga sp.]